MKAYLTENQFLIAIGMSEAKIIYLHYHEQKLHLKATGINVLFDFSKLDLFNPDISYDEWLKIKYIDPSDDREQFKHIFIDDEAEFIIDNPTIYYEGEQDQFHTLLGRFDLNPIDNAQHKYIFGGIYQDSAHDEFEVHTNSPIELHIPDHIIRNSLSTDQENKFLKLDIAIEKAKHKQEIKGKLKKRNNNQKISLQV
ncbi:hypothetical protein ACQKGD_19650 [Peribacillus frigoritolerans]|jgi:hypothetical protein|uniref:hypothetical protein n=1 Tax=Peribacillus frigoritolerans TaxID=450367 RepID=UPI003CFC329E